MEQIIFNGMLIVGLVLIISLLTAIITPMLKLNTSIVTLNNTIQSLIKNDGKQDELIKEHGETINDHETRITVLEKK